MELDLLPALVALADAGSLTAAGRVLGLSQPAVHQQLARLAEQVGRPVYRREGRRLVLTDAGVRLLALGRDVAAAQGRALAELEGRDVALPVLCAGRGVWLHRIRKLPPCRPMVADGAGTLAAVLDGRATLGIAAVEASPGVSSRDLWTVGSVVAVPAFHALADRPEVSFADLAGQAWVLPPRGSPLREAVHAHLGEVRVAVQTAGWDLQLRFVALGAGITVVNAGVMLPAGVAGVPLRGLPPVCYRALWRPGSAVESLLAAVHAG
ncbi:MAG: DNA-binding transcriptional LysR family regulator [Myxococcota bacterium]|jgi:DNA-binding transcriptional LysR family regulator